jgi:L-iditol 2-dehydrogenase
MATLMRAARLHGPSDVRIESLPRPGAPGPGEALLRVRAVGICGSDLHTYLDGRISSTQLPQPLIPGHEFAGVIQAVGDGATGGAGAMLAVGAAVAVDPLQACGKCELCLTGNPNLCLDHKFCGLSPTDGAMCQWMIVPANTCFPIEGLGLEPSRLFAEGALLETLGVALHAVDLAHIKLGDFVAIVGAGPIGLCILQAAKRAGARKVFVTDQLSWRLDLARELGAETISCRNQDPAEIVMRLTDGRGVDVAIEAAWADRSIQQAADMTRNGGRLVLVGIPGDDQLILRHSVARRKGLTIRMSRRMKHAYPRAIALRREGAIDLHRLVTHRFPLERAAEAFALNARYEPGVVKVMIDVETD